jgi:Uma2 family endonuclease
VCVVLGPFVEGHLERAPDLCVEIRSPDDAVSDQIAKFGDYFANGCKLGWLMLPEEKSVLVMTPGASPRVARVGDRLDGGEVLSGLEIAVADLFT